MKNAVQDNIEPVYVTADETDRAFFEVAGKLSLKDFNITITNFVKEVHQCFVTCY